VLCLSQSGRSFQVRSNRPASRSPERPKRPFPSRKEDFNAKAPRKIALVTGGSSGIGLATAKRFVEEGAFVYIAARRQTEMDKAALLIGRNVAAVRGGVSNLADLDRLYTKIASEKGRIDILFGGAGIVDPQPLGETTEESFDKLFATNTRALAFTVKKALPLLNDAGAIIVITSIAENKGILCFTAYSASKAAVRSLVRTWRAELKDRRIRVNAISPGPIDTPIFEQQAPTKEGADQARAQFAASVPFGRLGRPEEIASTALFLASDEASFIAGVDLPVDGGMTAI
jgi:NAD(P)-dependent dehydrogenase (short-subunit alcohol dehydrogenase family)